MADAQLSTSITSISERASEVAVSASADELQKISRVAPSLEQSENAALEVAINTRAAAIAGTASASDLKKIGKAIGNMLEPQTASVSGEFIGSQTNHSGKFFSTNGTAKNWGGVTMGGLQQVQLSTIENDQTLVYNSVSGKFENSSRAFDIPQYSLTQNLPASANAGEVVFDVQSSQLKYWNGTEWKVAAVVATGGTAGGVTWTRGSSFNIAHPESNLTPSYGGWETGPATQGPPRIDAYGNYLAIADSFNQSDNSGNANARRGRVYIYDMSNSSTVPIRTYKSESINSYDSQEFGKRIKFWKNPSNDKLYVLISLHGATQTYAFNVTDGSLSPEFQFGGYSSGFSSQNKGVITPDGNYYILPGGAPRGVYVYDLINTQTTHKWFVGKNTSNGQELRDYNGIFVDASTGKLIITDPYANSNTGQVEIYDISDLSTQAPNLLASYYFDSPYGSAYYGYTAAYDPSSQYLYLGHDSSGGGQVDNPPVYVYDVSALTSTDGGKHALPTPVISIPNPRVDESGNAYPKNSHVGWTRGGIHILSDRLYIADSSGTSNGAVGNGVIHVFNKSDGSHLETIANPHPELRARFARQGFVIGEDPDSDTAYLMGTANVNSGAGEGQYWNNETDYMAMGYVFTKDSASSGSGESSSSPTSSIQFDGSDDYLTVDFQSTVISSNEEFTVEFWISPNDLANNYGNGLLNFTNNLGTYEKLLYISSTGNVSLYNNGDITSNSGGGLTVDGWHHIALTRQSDNYIRIYIDGQLINTSSSQWDVELPRYLEIGRVSSTTGYFDGELADLRIVKGTSVYNANFTPTTSPLGDVAGTSLLISSSNTTDIVDASSSNETITASGSPTVVTDTPYTASGGGSEQSSESSGESTPTITYKMVVGADRDDDNGGLQTGSVYVYDLDGSNEVKITASDAQQGDQFGRDVATGNDKIVVGAYKEDTRGDAAGKAYIYDLDGTNEVILCPTDLSAGDNFGVAVAAGNNKVAVGANAQSDYDGAVYVYDLDGTNEVKITPSAGAGNSFGRSVVIGHNKLAVGAEGNGGAGAVCVYDLDGTNEVIITGSDSTPNARFGSYEQSLAIGENKIVVGASQQTGPGGVDSGQNNYGAVYVYDLDGTNEVKITASDAGTEHDYFGWSVAVGESKIAVGARFQDSAVNNGGKVYLYDLDGSNEIQIVASDPDVDDNFGFDVAIANGKVIVGSNDDKTGANNGAVYVYDLDGSNEVKVLASDGAISDLFGQSIAVPTVAGVTSSGSSSSSSTPVDWSPLTLIQTAGKSVHTITGGTTGESDLAVDMTETYTVLGVDKAYSGYGSAYIIDTVSGNVTATINNPNPLTSGSFARRNSVGTDGVHVVLGNRDQDEVYVYNMSGQIQRTISGPDSGAMFGHSVKIDGDYIVVGGYNQDKAYICSTSTGAVLYTLTNPNVYGSTPDQFGQVVDISGNFMVVSTVEEDAADGSNSGVAYVYTVDAGSLLHTFVNPNAHGTSALDNFGIDCALDGNYLVVGAFGESDAAVGSGSGKAYFYNVATGTLLHTIDNPNPDSGTEVDYMGWSVDVEGQTAIVSAWYETGAAGADSGKCYLYDVVSGNLLHTIEDPNVYSGGGTDDRFGSEVAISGTFIAISAKGEDHASQNNVGAIYVFKGE
tara:strand:- start:2047 stop:6960 length:4914 start_codon:yes stop_codon:yes gene_type:complete